jgi:molybdopterin converting factor small subunit
VARVHFGSALQRHTGGVEQLDVDAPRVHELLQQLVARYPGLREQLEQMAVAVDGEIYGDAAYRKLSPESEVHFVPKIGGG